VTTNQTDVTFRAATADDGPAVLALVTSAYRGESSRAGWTTEADLLDGPRTDLAGISEIITGADSLVLLAETGSPGESDRAGEGRVLACCQLERRGPVAYFGMFAVRPTLQAGGIGSALLAEAERYTRVVWGAELLEMQVISRRAELIAWYRRRGYAPTGATRPFPYGDERFGLPKLADLAFTVLSKPLTAH
jgi:GNAT superfamily N-acetyltransferase